MYHVHPDNVTKMDPLCIGTLARLWHIVATAANSEMTRMQRKANLLDLSKALEWAWCSIAYCISWMTFPPHLKVWQTYNAANLCDYLSHPNTCFTRAWLQWCLQLRYGGLIAILKVGINGLWSLWSPKAQLHSKVLVLVTKLTNVAMGFKRWDIQTSEELQAYYIIYDFSIWRSTRWYCRTSKCYYSGFALLESQFLVVMFLP